MATSASDPTGSTPPRRELERHPDLRVAVQELGKQRRDERAAEREGAVTRSRPRGAPRTWLTAVSACSTSARIRRACRCKSRPVSVSTRRRFVRRSRAAPSRSSSRSSERLAVDFGTRSAAAAAGKALQLGGAHEDLQVLQVEAEAVQTSFHFWYGGSRALRSCRRSQAA